MESLSIQKGNESKKPSFAGELSYELYTDRFTASSRLQGREHCRNAHADGAADAADYFLCVVETLAEHLGGAEHRDKGVEVFLMDKCLQLQCLAVGEGRIDHIVGPVGVGTVAAVSYTHLRAHET